MPDIRIRISNGVKTAGTGQESQETGNPAKQDMTKNAVVSIFAHQMLATSKEALNTSVSLIGIETGNYLQQKQIETIVNVATSSIGTAVALTTNPLLGIAKISADIFSYGMKAYTEIRKYQVNEKNAQILRRRTGNTLTDGSRTGD